MIEKVRQKIATETNIRLLANEFKTGKDKIFNILNINFKHKEKSVLGFRNTL